MNALSKILLVTASFQSLFILSMEQTQTPTQSTDIITEHKESLTQLYSLTQYVLTNSESLGQIHTLFSEKPTHSLLTIIATTNDLRKKRMTEEHVARFAYTKQLSRLEKDQSILDKIESFVSSNNQINDNHIAVFFKRIEIFNNHLAKNDFTTPTFEDYKNYIANKGIETSFKKAIKKAKAFGVLLDETMIHTSQPPFIDIPMNIATEELDKLISDIKTMCDKNVPLIKSLADLLYLNNKEDDTHTNTTENKDK